MKKEIQFRNILFLIILFIAWACFEIINYSTTEQAFYDIIGEVSFVLMGFKWSKVAAVAFCLVDFVGIARAFTPQKWEDEPQEVVFLTGAWLLASAFNGFATWWAVSLQIEANAQPHTFVDMADVLKWAPVLLALAMLVLRVTIIGAVSMELEKFLHPQNAKVTSKNATRVKTSSPKQTNRTFSPRSRRTAVASPRTQSNLTRVSPRGTLPVAKPPSQPEPSSENWSIDDFLNG